MWEMIQRGGPMVYLIILASIYWSTFTFAEELLSRDNISLENADSP